VKQVGKNVAMNAHIAISNDAEEDDERERDNNASYCHNNC
jgi:hypothetical protein